MYDLELQLQINYISGSSLIADIMTNVREKSLMVAW